MKKHQQQILTTQLLILDVDASKNRLLINSQQLKKIPQMMRMLQMLMVEVLSSVDLFLSIFLFKNEIKSKFGFLSNLRFRVSV